MKYKEIETPRLILRKFEDNDLEFIYKHFSSSYVSRYLYDAEPPESIEEAKWIHGWCLGIGSEKHIRWCIVIKGDNKQIGTIGFHRYDKDNNSAEIGFDLSEEYVRKGIMTEAMKAVLEYGFREYNLNRVYACVSVENVACNSLLESFGFTLEGTFRDELLFRGKYYDHNHHSLLKREF